MTAPSLFNPGKGTVHVWSKDGAIPKALAELIDGDVQQIGHAHSDDTGTVDARRDLHWTSDNRPFGRLYVTAGRGDDRAVQSAAWRAGALDGPACLPTPRDPGAGQWLRERIARRVNAGLDVTVVVRGGAW